jgi:hypothetical protein
LLDVVRDHLQQQKDIPKKFQRRLRIQKDCSSRLFLGRLFQMKFQKMSHAIKYHTVRKEGNSLFLKLKELGNTEFISVVSRVNNLPVFDASWIQSLISRSASPI